MFSKYFVFQEKSKVPAEVSPVPENMSDLWRLQLVNWQCRKLALALNLPATRSVLLAIRTVGVAAR